jgi:hypothetical protein
MRISKREKLFIIIFLISIIVYLGDRFLPTIISKKLSINEDYTQIKEMYDCMALNISLKDFYEWERLKLMFEVRDFNMLSDIKQEDIIEILNKNLASSGIEIVNINFSEVFLTGVNTLENELLVESNSDGYVSNDNLDLNKSESENDQLSVLTMLVNVEFKSSYENVLTLIDKLHKNQYDIAITNIHIVKSDYNKVYGVVDINFYAIPLNY